MSQRLVFTAPAGPKSESVISYLQANGFSDESISVLGSMDVTESDLPDGGFLENDALPAVKRGATVGGTVGLVAGLSAVTIAPGILLAGAAVALSATGGASLGALGASIVGASVPNSQVRKYTEAMERGELLLVIEVDEKGTLVWEKTLTEKFTFLNFYGALDKSIPVV